MKKQNTYLSLYWSWNKQFKHMYLYSMYRNHVLNIYLLPMSVFFIWNWTMQQPWSVQYMGMYFQFTAGLGIRSFAHFAHFAHFAQIKWATVSNLLRSLKTNERLWVNRSGLTRQMIDRKRIVQVPHDKWAIVSESLRSLMTNEQPWAIRSGAHDKWANKRFAQKNLAKKILNLIF